MDVCIKHSNALIENGADVICMVDSVADPEVIDSELFEIFIKPVYQRYCKIENVFISYFEIYGD